ncbi:MAG TPA: MaoC/PaaZ C-terminal domain-containing protein [Acidimicrobiales bacterium]|nr:MaoC/PaaZ C-terminal domain-containing protein [Acidimicrobiales bacterium]
MPINPDAVGTTGGSVEKTWTSTDCLLYALSVGAGAIDPTGFELEFTTENSAEITQRVLPSFAVVAGFGDASAFATIGTFNPFMLVHGEQAFELHAPLPVEGHISTVTTITGIYDKGSGAVIATESVSTDVGTGDALFTNRSSVFIRGEGGWGGDRGPSGKAEPPARQPDQQVTYGTRADQALLYRLNGDRNPLHSDPKFAAMAGFPKPILHGLCTYGFTARALLHTLCGSDPDRFVSMAGRFSKPVFPGDDLTISLWALEEGEAFFQTSTQRGEVVIDAGRCTFRV